MPPHTKAKLGWFFCTWVVVCCFLLPHTTSAESFNFEVARRTHDSIKGFLGAADFPLQQIVEAFPLDILHVDSPTYYTKTRRLVVSLLNAVPQVGALEIHVEDTFVGISRTNHTVLTTTERVFGLNCSIVVSAENQTCVHVALVDDVGAPKSDVGTQSIDLTLPRYTPSNTSNWSPVIQLSPTEMGVSYTHELKVQHTTQTNTTQTNTTTTTTTTIGTVSATVMLSNLDTFLHNAFAHETDQRVVYIAERGSGKLIATSVAGISVAMSGSEALVQVKAWECSNRLVRESSAFLFGLSDLASEVLYVNNGYYVQSTPYTAAGIDWLVVVVRPADIQDEYISSSSSTYLVMCVIIALCVCVTLSLVAWVVRFRKLRLWKAAQPTALFLVLFANLTCIGAAFTLMGRPSNALCVSRQIFLPFSMSLTCSALIAKLMRVYLATGTRNMFRQDVFTRLNARHVLLIVGVIMSIQVAHLLAWVIVDPLQPTLKYRSEFGVVVGYEVCKSSTVAWTASAAVFCCLLVMVGCYLSYVTRDVSELFAESRALMLTFYHATLIAAVLFLVRIFANVSLRAFFLFALAALLWFTLTTQFALFLPRIYRQVTLGDFSLWEVKEMVRKNLTRNVHFPDERQSHDDANSTARVIYAAPSMLTSKNSTARLSRDQTSKLVLEECTYVI